MHDESPNPSPLTNAVCMHCGYDISGTSLNADGIVTCPECGTELIRSSRTILSRRNVQTHLIRSLIVMAFILFCPLALPGMFIVEWTRTHRDTAPHPRPYPLWACAYATPILLIYIGTVVLMGRML